MFESLAVFVNSSDGFQDCWSPFFKLYSLYGGGLRKVPIYLNTEKAKFSYEGLCIRSTETWPDSEPQRPTWSECLIRGLNVMRESFVLYLQEDYFLTRQVDDSRIAAALEILSSDPRVGVVYLNKYGPRFLQGLPYCQDFVEVKFPARYLISTQSAIWRKDFFLSNIYPWENGWMFEKFGGLRVLRSDFKLLSVSPELMLASPALDYIYTGVIKGLWKEECVEHFKKHGIEIDFRKRGFYIETGGRLKTRMEVLRKLIGEPKGTLRSLGTLFQ